MRILKLNEMAFVRNVEELKSNLQKSICEFVYTKKDGSRRTAFGTLNSEFILSSGGRMPSGFEDERSMKRKETLRNSGYITYYDLEKGAWRNCKAYSEEDIDLIETYDTMEELIAAHPVFA